MIDGGLRGQQAQLGHAYLDRKVENFRPHADRKYVGRLLA
jgi:hypothetical protein